MTAHANNLDLMAPPVVKTIQRRSLIIGLIFAAISLVLAFVRPDEFFRAYLLGYMCWLGVTLGSMAILMIRHLTGGGWGMVIRRILGAAMRCLPLMAVLFVPILFGLPKLYVWARPLDSIADQHLREHLQDLAKSYLNVHGIYYSRRDLPGHLESVVVPAHQVVEGTGQRFIARQHRAFQGRKRARPDSVRIHDFIRRHRLDHVHRPELDFDHLWIVDPHRRIAFGDVFRRRRRANSGELQADVRTVET